MWKNNTVYYGSLNEYHYPTDKEVGDFLKFLKRIDSNRRIYLIDVPKWDLLLPPTDYDIYIVCMFGEAVNDQFVNQLDNHPDFANKHIILLTSQYYDNIAYKNVRVFYIEHLHTVIPFLPKPEYTQLADRSFTHGALSNRNAIHKTVLTAKILHQFKDDVQYSFCNGESTEYTDPDSIINVMAELGLSLDKNCVDIIHSLHKNPVMVPGGSWSVDNHIYRDSQLIWTAESIFLSRDSGPIAYITEKILKSIISGSCFVAVAQRQTLKRLKQLGFETYEEEFGISYDNKYDHDRYSDIFNLIENFDFNLESKHIQDIADYNHNYFYNKFYNRIEIDNVDRIEQLIEYINAI